MPTLNGTPDEALPRRERERAAHRREILDAAVKVFARKGVAAATMDEIAQEAEFSKGAVYLHFAGKDELLCTILDEVTAATLGVVREGLSGARSLRQELGALYQQAAEFAFSHVLPMGAPMPLHLSEFSSMSELVRSRVLAAQHEMIGILSDRIRKAQAAGEVRDVSVEAVAGLVHGAMDSMVLTRWGRDTLDELRVAADNVIEILFGGIAQPQPNHVSQPSKE